MPKVAAPIANGVLRFRSFAPLSLAGVASTTLGGVAIAVTGFVAVIGGAFSIVFGAVNKFNEVFYSIVGTVAKVVGEVVGKVAEIAGAVLQMAGQVAGAVAQAGTVNQNQVLTYTGAIAGTYTVQIGDGACTQMYTFDASGCVTPCVPVTVNTSLSACAGTSVVLQGAAQTQAGTYIDSLVTPLGCDSVIITQLSFLPPIPLTQQSISICSGGSYTLNGNTYNTPGAYLDTLNSVNGCDSVILTNLQFSPTLTSLVNQNICSGSSYNFNGTLLSAEGIYTDTLSATGGCDSVIILALYINPPLTQNVNTSICEGESYTFNGTVLTESGIYVDSLSTATGCDSLVTLELAVTTCSGDFEIANILTPNGDGQNDTWKIDNPNQISGCEVKIYNRWGQLIHRSQGENPTWDGKIDNVDCPEGVYAYNFDCNYSSSKIQKYGTFQLIRKY